MLLLAGHAIESVKRSIHLSNVCEQSYIDMQKHNGDYVLPISTKYFSQLSQIKLSLCMIPLISFPSGSQPPPCYAGLNRN